MRLIRAPTIFGRACISGASFIGVGAFAQRLPLRLVVTAQHDGAARLDAPDLGERLGQRLGVPGVARNDAGIEGRAQADGVGSEQERSGLIERDQRARSNPAYGRAAAISTMRPSPKRSRSPSIASGGAGLLPLGGEIALPLPAARRQRAAATSLAWMMQDAARSKKVVAAATVGMQVPAHDHVDVVAVEPDAGQRR